MGILDTIGQVIEPGATNPFGKEADAAVARKAGAANAAAEQVTTVLGAVTEGLTQIANERIGAEEATSNKRREIAGVIEEQQKGVQAAVAPLFARRAELNQREQELAAMNPLVRGIKGIFDRNYNDKFVAAEERRVEDQIADLSGENEILTQTQLRLLGVVDQVQKASNDELNANQSKLNQDFALAQQGLQAAMTELSALGAGYDAKSGQLLLKARMIDEQLSGLDSVSLQAAMEDAQKRGGVALVGGAEIPVAMLKLRRDQLLQQEYGLQAAKANRDSARAGAAIAGMRLDEARQEVFLKNMSFSDVQTALQNNGQFKGLKLDPVALAQRAEGLVASMTVSNNLATGKDYAEVITNGWQSLAGVQQQFIGRLKSMGGIMPDVATQYLTQSRVEVADYNRKLAKAQGNPAAMAALAREVSATVGNSVKQLNDTAFKIAARMSNDKDAQLVLAANLTGAPMTAEAATKGIIALTRNGAMPSNLNLTGPAGIALDAVRKRLASLTNTAEYKEANQAERAVLEQRAATEVMEKTWNQQAASRVFQAIPAAAAQANHPLGKMISPAEWRTADGAAEDYAYGVVAKEMGFRSAASLKEFMKGDVTKAPDYNPKAPNSPTKIRVGDVENALDRNHLPAFVSHLDNIAPGAGRQLVNFLGSPAGAKFVDDSSMALSNSDFGARLVSSAAGGNLASRLSSHMTALAQSADASERSIMNARLMTAQRFGGDPKSTVQAVLSMNQNITPNDRKLLVAALMEEAGSAAQASVMASAGMGVGFGDPSLRRQVTNELVEGVLTGGKFADPNLERIRKIAARDYIDSKRKLNAAVANLKGEDD